MTGKSTTMGWQAIVHDPESLSGASVRRLLRAVSEALGIECAIVLEAEGGGEKFEELLGFADSRKLLRVESLALICGQLDQIDWADFVLAPTDRGRSVVALESALDALESGRVVVRCVDDQYFYIYGADAEDLRMLERKLLGSGTFDGKWARSDQLDFPV